MKTTKTPMVSLPAASRRPNRPNVLWTWTEKNGHSISEFSLNASVALAERIAK